MTCRIFLRTFFAGIVLLFLEDFDELDSIFAAKGDRRSRMTSGAPMRDRSQVRSDPDPTRYLRQYGYLPPSDQETLALRTDGEMQSAIRRFQRMAGIQATGKMDVATINAMRRARCGKPDVAPLEYKIGPSRWEKQLITYRILSYTSDVSMTSVNDAIAAAMRVWSEVTPLTFQQEYSGEADLMVSFSRLNHGDGYAFDGEGMVLAHAFPPGEGRGGDIHFDDDETWSVHSADGVNLFIVAAHELGHSLGLLHSQDQMSLMYPVYQGYQPSLRLSSDDIKGIRMIYGSGSGVTVRPPPRYPSRTVSPTPFVRSYTQRRWVEQPTPSDVPDLCSSRYDAVARIRGDVFVFSGKWFWRLKENDDAPVDRHLISFFWKGLPVNLDRLDAAFERPSDGKIFFFRGRKYWEFVANNLSPGFPGSGRPITDFGFPLSVGHLDAAFNWEMNQRVYVISGDIYWRLTPFGNQTEPGYPLSMEIWSGITLPVDAAFTHFDGRTYFIQDQQFWRLVKGQTQATPGSPKRTSSIWMQCRGDAATPSIRLLSTLQLLLVYVLLTFSYCL